jgi:hypothetical protein
MNFGTEEGAAAVMTVAIAGGGRVLSHCCFYCEVAAHPTVTLSPGIACLSQNIDGMRSGRKTMNPKDEDFIRHHWSRLSRGDASLQPLA